MQEREKLRQELVRLAHSHPQTRIHLVPLLREAGETSPTEEGAKALFERYREQHPNTKKTPKDFHDPSSSTSKPNKGGLLGKAMAKFKNVSSAIAKQVKSGGEKVQKFVADPQHRNVVVKASATELKKSHKTVASKLLKGLKAEVHELKEASHAIKKVFKKEDLSKHEKKALISAGVYLGVSAVAATTGGVAAVGGAILHSFGFHVGFKATHQLLDDGFLVFEGKVIGAGILDILSKIATEQEITDEQAQELMVNNILAHVIRQLEKGISDEEMAEIMKGEKSTSPEK